MDNDISVSASSINQNTGTERVTLLAFVKDAESEAALREGLAGALPQGLTVLRGNIRDAIAALGRMMTPRALIVDITGESQPLALLTDLSHIVEPNVTVMIIGDREDVAFYRQVTRMLGAAEYLYKPLVPEMVARHFGILFTQRSAGAGAIGGRMVSVTGVRGGTGATTVAINLAWQIAEAARRHTVVLDADLHAGNAAMMLKGKAGSALRTALENPQRVDELFVERAAIPVSERLYLLAAEEMFADRPAYAEDAAGTLVSMLRRRFNFVVGDVPFRDTGWSRDLLDLSQQRILVLLPTLSCMRDTLRMLALSRGNQQARRAVLVLNRAGMPGGLPTSTIEEALQTKIDVQVPDLQRQICVAENLGEPLVTQHGQFRNAIMELAKEVAFGSIAPAARRTRLRWRT